MTTSRSRAVAILAAAIGLAAASSHAVQHAGRAPQPGQPLTAATPVRPLAEPAPAPAPVAEMAPAFALFEALRPLAPGLDADVLGMALGARECAIASGEVADVSRLAVIDYSLPSTQKRMWVFDLDAQTLLFSEHVAHGKNTGANMATKFSNVEGSLQTSLGLFTTAETYQGGNGYSMRMDGLEPGFNDHARARAIVVHGAAYVNPDGARSMGRLGRSFGCPAVRTAVARQIIDTLKDGQMLFSYYPDDAWLASSPFLNCKAATSGLAAMSKASMLQGRALADAGTTVRR